MRRDRDRLDECPGVVRERLGQPVEPVERSVERVRHAAGRLEPHHA